ncbi:MAG: hypothetical protein H7318_03910 [Oligoflexus sp.]|nr:hypothetical protein [Oligoflexus sp.]
MFQSGKQIPYIVSLLTIAICLSSPSVAAAKKKKKKKGNWTFEQTYKLLGAVQQGAIAKELTNPDNQVYQLPVQTASIEFRPELQGTYKRYKLVLRPRASIVDDFRDITPLDPAPPGYVASKASDVKSEAYLNEAYFAGTPTSKLQYVMGLQNFQWGPAELASPSNPLFRDLGLSKTTFYETRGRGLLRANYSPSGPTTFIFISEVFDNGVKRDASDPEFRKKGVMKAEFADQSQTNYVGLVLSGAEDDKPLYGSYANYEVFTGLTVYYDMQARVGSMLWKPLLSGTGATFQQSLKAESKTVYAGLTGFRYVTESNLDFRLETFYEESAWTPDERQLGRGVIATVPTLENTQIYLNPGSFFPGQKFLYGSLRIPEWGYKDRFTIAIRDLYSITDQTQKPQVVFDTYIGDSILISTGVTAAFGKADGELTQGYQWQAFFTAAWTL